MNYKIIIGAPMWSSIRDLLRSDVLHVLLSRNIEIVVVSPNVHDKGFREEFSKLGIRLESIRKPQNKSLLKLEGLLNTCSNLFISNYVSTYKVRYLTMGHSIVIVTLVKLISLLPEKFCKNAALFFSALRGRVMEKKLYEDLIEEVNPAIVVCNFALGTSERALDRYLAASAKKKRIPLVIQMNGWDNLTTKGMFAFRPDLLLVWTKIMKDEAVMYHNFNPEEVMITGCPGHDVFFNKRNFLVNSREDFLKNLRLNPKNKTITYAAGGFGTYPEESALIKSMYLNLRTHFGDKFQLLVRPHPVFKKEEFEELEELIRNNDNLVIDFPGNLKKQYGVGADLNKQALSHFVETLYYSDVVINFFSTINIDACALDTKVINLCFTPKEYPLSKSPLRFARYTHNHNLHHRGFIPNVKSMKELIEWCEKYFEDAELLKEERQKVVDLFCWRLDGKSGVRTAEAIIDFVEGRKVNDKYEMA